MDDEGHSELVKVGQSLSHYRIAELVDRGGMGAVYRARDEHLPRDVAIKVLLPGTFNSENSRSRFRQEAQVLSKLEHANIAIIYDFDTQDGVDFLAMEFIPGQNLKARIEEGPLPEDELVELALQLVEGLTVAHSAGIVHRDLKPSNIRLTPEGRLKIVDFGLAKKIEVDQESRTISHLSVGPTGTPPYMAPEQLLGMNVDARTDIHAVGVILYEMVTCRRPFNQRVPAALSDEILNKEASPPSNSNPAISTGLEGIILKCLAKDPGDRYESSQELLADLRDHRKRRRLPPVPTRVRVAQAGGLAALVVLMTAVVWMWWSSRENGALPEMNPTRVTTHEAWDAQPALSPDGSQIVFTSNRSGNLDLFLIGALGGQAQQLTTQTGTDQHPTWFPDGQSLAFASDRSGQMDIWRIDPSGGNATLVIRDAAEPAVSPDGTQISFSRVMPDGYPRIGVADLNDPMRQEILTGQNSGHWGQCQPTWSPDGETICYAGWHSLWLVPATGGEAVRLTSVARRDMDPVWSSDGRNVYFTSYSGGQPGLWRVDLEGGEPERVRPATGPEGSPSLSLDRARLALSTARTERELVLLDRELGHEVFLSGLGDDLFATIAPDNSQVVIASNRLGTSLDLVMQPLDAGIPSGPPELLTPIQGNASHPTWSADGEWVAYYSIVGDQRDIWIVSSSGGQPIQFTGHPAFDHQPAWSPDGSKLAFVSDRSGGEQIWIAPVEADQSAGPAWQLTDVEMSVHAPDWSPDGSTIAFVGVKGDQREVWLVPGDGSAPARQITTGVQAWYVRWDPLTDGLLASSSRNGEQTTLLAVPLDGGAIEPTDPPVVFGSPAAIGAFEVSFDGRFLVVSRETPRGDIWILEALRGVF